MFSETFTEAFKTNDIWDLGSIFVFSNKGFQRTLAQTENNSNGLQILLNLRIVLQVYKVGKHWPTLSESKKYK